MKDLPKRIKKWNFQNTISDDYIASMERELQEYRDLLEEIEASSILLDWSGRIARLLKKYPND